MSPWAEIDSGHLGLAAVFCCLCGQRIARRAWTALVLDKEMRFCSEKCAGLMESYFIPKYGSARLLPGEARPNRSGK